MTMNKFEIKRRAEVEAIATAAAERVVTASAEQQAETLTDQRLREQLVALIKAGKAAGMVDGQALSWAMSHFAAGRTADDPIVVGELNVMRGGRTESTRIGVAEISCRIPHEAGAAGGIGELAARHWAGKRKE